MSFVLIRTFLSIVETGSLIKASQQLNVTQSTVTARLQSLEEDLGQILLHRHKSGVSLTSAGIKFKRYAVTMHDLWKQARQETSLPEGIDAVCNLACDIDMWRIIGCRLVSEVRSNHPSIAISVKPGNQNQIEQWLADGLVEVALTYTPVNHENHSMDELGEESLVLYSTRPDSPMRSDPQYVYVDAGEDFGRKHTKAYSDAGIAKTEFGVAVWALDHLMASGGSAYLPERLAESYVSDGKLFIIPDAPKFKRNMFLISNKQALISWPWLPEMAKDLLI